MLSIDELAGILMLGKGLDEICAITVNPEIAMLPRVLLADDHPAVLEKVASLLASTCEVVGKVADGKALLAAEAHLHPDLLIVDISMPVLNGIEAARQLRTSGTLTRIVFLTVHEDPDFVQVALAAGGCGYVVKSRLATDLISAVQSALADRQFISPSLIPKNPVSTP